MKLITRMIVCSLSAFAIAACSLTLNLVKTPSPTSVMPVQSTTTAILPTSTNTMPSILQTQQITVYFTDQNRFAIGTEPYEVAVNREVPAGIDPMRAVLNAFFAGPTAVETGQGLILVSSGFTGVRDFTIQNGIARVFLDGNCAKNGAAYSVANLIGKNLSQFPQVTAVKIFDENGSNLDPDSPNSSLPYCLEP